MQFFRGDRFRLPVVIPAKAGIQGGAVIRSWHYIYMETAASQSALLARLESRRFRKISGRSPKGVYWESMSSTTSWTLLSCVQCSTVNVTLNS